MEIMCALNEGIEGLKKHLQEAADVSRGGRLNDVDKEFLRTAEVFMKNKDYVEVARDFQRQIEWHNRNSTDLSAQVIALQARIAEIEDNDKEEG